MNVFPVVRVRWEKVAFAEFLCSYKTGVMNYSSWYIRLGKRLVKMYEISKFVIPIRVRKKRYNIYFEKEFQDIYMYEHFL